MLSINWKAPTVVNVRAVEERTDKLIIASNDVAYIGVIVFVTTLQRSLGHTRSSEKLELFTSLLIQKTNADANNLWSIGYHMCACLKFVWGRTNRFLFKK